MSRAILFTCMGLLLLSTGLRAQSLRDVVAIALQNNPEVKAAQQAAEAARARIPVMGSLPDPEIAIESMELRSFSPSISQTFPLFGKLSAKEKSAYHMHQEQLFRYRQIKRDVSAAVAEHYFSLWFRDEQIQLLREKKAILQRIATVAESQYTAASDTSQLDVLQIQLEVLSATNALTSAETMRAADLAKLNALLGRELTISLHPKMEKIATASPEAAPTTPEMLAAEQQVLRATQELEMVRNDALPDLTVQYSLPMASTATSPFLSLKLSLPFLWSWQRTSSIDALQLDRDMAQAMRDQTRIRVQEDRFVASVLAQDNQRALQFFSATLIPHAEQALRIAQARYQSGQLPFLDLMNTVRTLNNLKLEYVTLYKEYAIATARQTRVAGGEDHE